MILCVALTLKILVCDPSADVCDHLLSKLLPFPCWACDSHSCCWAFGSYTSVIHNTHAVQLSCLLPVFPFLSEPHIMNWAVRFMGSLTTPLLDLIGLNSFVFLGRVRSNSPWGYCIGGLRLCGGNTCCSIDHPKILLPSQVSRLYKWACMRVFQILSAVWTHHPGLSLVFSEASYRYSTLRGMEEQGSAMTEGGDTGPCTVGEESDEVSASWLPWLYFSLFTVVYPTETQLLLSFSSHVMSFFLMTGSSGISVRGGCCRTGWVSFGWIVCLRTSAKDCFPCRWILWSSQHQKKVRKYPSSFSSSSNVFSCQV